MFLRLKIDFKHQIFAIFNRTEVIDIKKVFDYNSSICIYQHPVNSFCKSLTTVDTLTFTSLIEQWLQLLFEQSSFYLLIDPNSQCCFTM